MLFETLNDVGIHVQEQIGLKNSLPFTFWHAYQIVMDLEEIKEPGSCMKAIEIRFRSMKDTWEIDIISEKKYPNGCRVFMCNTFRFSTKWGSQNRWQCTAIQTPFNFTGVSISETVWTVK